MELAEVWCSRCGRPATVEITIDGKKESRCNEHLDDDQPPPG